MKIKQYSKRFTTILLGLIVSISLVHPSSVTAKPDNSEAFLSSSSLFYSTFFGGSDGEGDGRIVSAGNGIVYVAGTTHSADFPTTPGAYDTTYNNYVSTVFLAKINLNTKQLLYSTFIGGNSQQSNGPSVSDLKVDSTGAAYVLIVTDETTFPTTPGAYDRTYGGGLFDVAIAKINPTGTSLIFSSYIGGNSVDKARGMALDSLGSIYISGITDSNDFPTTSGAYQTTKASRSYWVLKMKADGSNLDYSTYIHGSTAEDYYGSVNLSASPDGIVYITGDTVSSDFPVTEGAFDRSFNGGYRDIFVTKLNSTGSNLLYSTFIGGERVDQSQAIYVDNIGNAYITGITYSISFPTTTGVFQKELGGGILGSQNGDAFITKLDSDGSALVYSTYLGGLAAEAGMDIDVDSKGFAYVVGSTGNTLPTTTDAYQPVSGGDWDGFAAKINPTANKLEYATYLGGSSYEFAQSMDLAKDIENTIYLTGWTRSTDFPVTPDAFHNTIHGDFDNFIVKISMGKPKPLPFLDLPFEYGNSTSNFFQVLKNWNANGQINSWFDHKYPSSSNWNKGDGIWLYNGDKKTEDPRAVSSTVLCYGDYCYDGHNGYDLIPQSESQKTIHPAATGKVVLVKSGCVKNDYRNGCGNFGNYVVVYHPGQGYFTLYGHLLSVSTSPDLPVSVSDTIGVMGSTGNSVGTHLHFGVYQDNGNNVWDGEGIDKPVDPFGWRSNIPDPWVADLGGPPSYPLWIHDPDQESSFLGSEGSTLTDASGTIKVTIPPDFFSGPVKIDLSTGPVAGSSAQLHSIGQSFLLKLLEGLLNSTSQLAVPRQNSIQYSLSQPITLSIAYNADNLKHLDANLLSLYHWDQTQKLWQPLNSTIDSNNHVVTAETSELGDFDLQAPLLCPSDSQEPNDDYFASSPMPPDDTNLTRLFDIAQDEDWFQVDSTVGYSYTINISNLSTGVDTVLEIYDTDGVTLLASDDNSAGGKASSLVWRPKINGTYFIRVKQAPGSSYGCNASYSINATAAAVPTFQDVSDSHWAWNYIERLYSAGITGGCTFSPLNYCPSNPVNRAQMAVFLLRAEHGYNYTPPTAAGVFADVPASDWTASWIEQLADEGITGGCTVTPKQYCPAATITRAQMAVFLLRAEHGANYTPPAAAGMFLDVPKTDWIAPWIEQLANEGITGGCGGGNYCPGKAVTRDQMAIFLVRAFDLP